MRTSVHHGIAAVGTALGLLLSGTAALAADNPTLGEPPPPNCVPGPARPGVRTCPKLPPIPVRPPEPTPGAEGRIDLTGGVGVRELVSDLVRAKLRERSESGSNRINLGDGLTALWGQSSDGRPDLCGRACVGAPFMNYSLGYDWWAQLNLSPRFSLALYLYGRYLTTFDATVPVRFKARCTGWQGLRGRMVAWFEQDRPRVSRTTIAPEDVIDYFTGVTDDINAYVRNRLAAEIGTSRQVVDSVRNGATCSSLGVRVGTTWESDAIVYDFAGVTLPPKR